ncbi:MAG TPA: peptidylprolyl isomerase [Acidimicrobiales bacterium]|nr:peptidylprolyl isomerase [Acidimicrobiales bacterium]
MKRLLALVVLGALCAGAAGCDLGPTAATVNGLTISQSSLQDQLSAITGSSVAQCALSIEESQSGGTLPPVGGTGDATVSTQFTAFELNGLIEQSLEQWSLARHHVEVTSSDVATAGQDYASQLEAAAAQTGSPCGLTGASLVGALPKKFLDRQALSLAYQEKLEEVVGHVDVSPAALRAYYDAHLTDVTQLCLNLIIATDQASAQAIHDKIAAGTSFATASQDPGVNSNSPAGGQGPCVYPSDVVAQLGPAAATAVEALGDGQLAPPQGIPVQSSTGATTVWVVIGVRQHHLVPFATAESGLRQGLLGMGGAKLTAALTSVVRSARVSLDPRYGTWSPGHGVAPPTSPKPAFLLNPAVDQTSGPSILGPSSQSTG